MRAAKRFAETLAASGLLRPTRRVRVELFGSLGATGHGHGTDRAVLWGLTGLDPETIDTDAAPGLAREIVERGRLRLGGHHEIGFDADEDLVMHRRRSLPFHPNGMTCTAYGRDGSEVLIRTYYSIGGGFVLDDDGSGHPTLRPDPTPVPYPFRSAGELLATCEREGLSIAEVMLANEAVHSSEADVRAGLLHLWEVMVACVVHGTSTPGVLPGGLRVRRRAADLRATLEGDGVAEQHAAGRAVDPLAALDW